MSLKLHIKNFWHTEGKLCWGKRGGHFWHIEVFFLFFFFLFYFAGGGWFYK